MIHDLELDGDPRRFAPRRRWWTSIWGLMKGVLAAGCGLWLLILFFNAVSCPTPYWVPCQNNLRQIALALYNYHDQYGSFPPAFVADAGGRPLHSWRVLILPFLEQQALYDRYDFREPWDGPNNIKLLDEMPPVFACPYPTDRTGRTNYVAVTGPGTIFPGAVPASLGQVKDGTSLTLMVVEVLDPDLPWTAPRDLDFETLAFGINAPNHPGIASRHMGGANVAMADGYVSFMTGRITPGRLRALATIAGGEKITPDEMH